MAGFFASRQRDGQSVQQFKSGLDRVYRWYALGLVIFVAVLAGLERIGLPRLWIGFAFLLATIGLYAGIGIISRTTDAAAYRRSTTAWRRGPTGCLPRHSLAWPARFT
jgi:cation/acetate symporter